MAILAFEDVSKIFRSGLTGRHLYTLGPVSFGIREGEIFGYLGPNGAGKTTTIKLALGLIKPTSGKIFCFGKPSTSAEVKKRIGFLPEQPYFYQHLTSLELMHFYGQMFGLSQAEIAKRAKNLLDITGLAEYRDTRLSKFSKGMLQRMGLAQALINDPDLVVLDEPLSGLDPVGRREIRDLILDLKGKGKTIFFSSHIIQDVEMISDRVGILSGGKILKVAKVAEVLEQSVRTVEVVTNGFPIEKAKQLGLPAMSRRGDKAVVSLPPGADVNRVINQLIASGARISAVVPLRQTLEDYFMSQVAAHEIDLRGPGEYGQRILQQTGGLK